MKASAFLPFAKSTTTVPSPITPALTSVGTAEQQLALMMALQTGEGFSVPFVGESSLMNLSAHWFCADHISHSVATMLVAANVFDDQGANVTGSHAWISKPTGTRESYNYWYSQVLAELVYGNAYSIIAYDGETPTLLSVHPGFVNVVVNESGEVRYHIGDNDFRSDQVLHVKGFHFPGWVRGQGVIERHRSALSTQLNMDGYQANTYRQGSVPSGILKLDISAKDAVNQDTLNAIKTEFDGRVQRSTLVATKDWDYTPISWTPEDMQFIAAMQFSAANTTLMWGLDPSVIGANIGNQSQTYANISDRDESRNKYVFSSHLYRFEQALSMLLPDGFKVKGNPEAILRGSAQTRAQILQLQVGKPYMTVNEARRLENLPPIEGGDVLSNAPEVTGL